MAMILNSYLTVAFFLIMLIGLIYLFLIWKTKVFPYSIVKKIYRLFANRFLHQWSIGIYEGTSPFDLKETKDLPNPVIRGSDIKDRDISFVADPFMVIKDDKFYMFFEAMDDRRKKGLIACAESQDCKKWNYKEIILEENFHLSYPYVFEWNGNYYLIPESGEDFSVRLYKASFFPSSWEYIGSLLTGKAFMDPSVFHHKDSWWMFVSYPDCDVLDLYYSDELFSGWKPHPMNPIIKNDKKFSRPGGRVFSFNKKLYRIGQDCQNYYGMQLHAREIVTITKVLYEEINVSSNPVLTKSGKGWNKVGMHHLDPHWYGGKWISAVDGMNKLNKNEKMRTKGKSI